MQPGEGMVTEHAQGGGGGQVGATQSCMMKVWCLGPCSCWRLPASEAKGV